MKDNVFTFHVKYISISWKNIKNSLLSFSNHLQEIILANFCIEKKNRWIHFLLKYYSSNLKLLLPHVDPSPLQTPQGSSSAVEPQVESQPEGPSSPQPQPKSTLPLQSQSPSGIPVPPQTPHSSGTADPPQVPAQSCTQKIRYY